MCLEGALLCWHFGTFYICYWGGGFPLSVDKEGNSPGNVHVQLILPVALHWNQYLLHVRRVGLNSAHTLHWQKTFRKWHWYTKFVLPFSHLGYFLCIQVKGQGQISYSYKMKYRLHNVTSFILDRTIKIHVNIYRGTNRN